MREQLRARYGLLVDEDVIEELLAALDGAAARQRARGGGARRGRGGVPRGAGAPGGAGGPRLPERAGRAAGDAGRLPRRGRRRRRAGDARARGLQPAHRLRARGHIYARVWARAAEIARAAELVVVLGTDHYGPEPIPLTRQSYATPYGVLPTDQGAIDALAGALGEDAFAGELFHRGEHSLELVAVWLHHMRGGEPVPLVPVLTGSFAPHVRRRRAPAEGDRIARLAQAVRAACAGRRALVVASGDLAHVGPAFGGAPLGEAEKRRLRAEDERVVARLGAGDAAGFFGAIAGCSATAATSAACRPATSRSTRWATRAARCSATTSAPPTTKARRRRSPAWCGASGLEAAGARGSRMPEHSAARRDRGRGDASDTDTRVRLERASTRSRRRSPARARHGCGLRRPASTSSTSTTAPGSTGAAADARSGGRRRGGRGSARA